MSRDRPRSLPSGKFVVMVHHVLSMENRSVMVCVEEPLTVKPGERVKLEVVDKQDGGRWALAVVGHRVQPVQ